MSVGSYKTGQPDERLALKALRPFEKAILRHEKRHVFRGYRKVYLLSSSSVLKKKVKS